MRQHKSTYQAADQQTEEKVLGSSLLPEDAFPHLLSRSLRDAYESHSDLTWTKCKDIWRGGVLLPAPPALCLNCNGHPMVCWTFFLCLVRCGPSQIPQSIEDTKPHLRSSLSSSKTQLEQGWELIWHHRPLWASSWWSCFPQRRVHPSGRPWNV